MHMKYFQALYDIKDHYEDILLLIEESDKAPHGHLLLQTWGIDLTEKEALIEEWEALRYLTSCQISVAHGSNAKKPTVSTVNRCLNRQLHYLDIIHQCNANTVQDHRLSQIRKQYQACRHYSFQFSLPGWVRNLPKEIGTFENKYADSRAL